MKMWQKIFPKVVEITKRKKNKYQILAYVLKTFFVNHFILQWFSKLLEFKTSSVSDISL